MNKKIILLVFVCAFCVVFAACKDGCMVKAPKHIEPIDWNNYNDAQNVFWNYYTVCSEIKEEDRGREIMVSGWISQGINKINLFFVKDSLHINDNNPLHTGNIPIVCKDPELQNKLDTSNVKKRCYVKGILRFDCLHIMSRVCESESRPKIEVSNANDIYFE
jgi:hypothetical protein